MDEWLDGGREEVWEELEESSQGRKVMCFFGSTWDVFELRVEGSPPKSVRLAIERDTGEAREEPRKGRDGHIEGMFHF